MRLMFRQFPTALMVVVACGCSRQEAFAAWSVYAGARITSVVVGDYNNDGRRDVVALDGSAGSVLFLAGNGVGTFTPPPRIATIISRGLNYGVGADFNADGRRDLAFVTAGSLKVMLGNGNGTFGDASTILNTADAKALRTGDVNNDGKADLVCLAELVGSPSASYQKVYTFLGTGTGAFSGPFYLPVSNGPQDVALADVNNDGNDDLVVAGIQQTRAYTSSGNGSYNVLAFVGDRGEVLAVGDLNSDGRPDIAVATRNGLTREKDGKAPPVTYEIRIHPATGDSVFGPGYLLANSAGVEVLGIQDLTGDGKADLVAGLDVLSAVRIWPGNNNTTFSSPFDRSVAGRIYGMAFGDFNGDGRRDLAVGAECGAVSVYVDALGKL